MRDWKLVVRTRLPPLDLEARREAEIVEELAAQLEDCYEEARREGASEEVAEARALAQFGDWDRLGREIARAERSGRIWRYAQGRLVRRRLPLVGLGHDLRYAVRNLVAHPGFSVVAILALALGIGANTLSFTLVDTLLLSSLPVEEPERLVRIYSDSEGGSGLSTVSYPDYLDIRQRLGGVFDGVLADKLVPCNLSMGERSERVWGYAVSGNYFSVLGLEPALGRFFLPREDETPGTHPVVVLAYSLWQQGFGGRKDVLGRAVHLNGHPFTVIGVAPKGFHGVHVGLHPGLWVPMMMQAQVLPGIDFLANRGARGHFAMGRLADGVTLEQARTALDVLASQLREAHPEDNRGVGFSLLPESEGGLHPMMRGGAIGFSGALFIVVALVLLLACANVAGLLVARGLARRREIGIRLAVGASRGRLLRQLLTESLVLAALAGGAGVLLAYAATRSLSSIRLPTDIPVRLHFTIDPEVLGFTLLVVLLTGILFGMVPALHATRFAVVPAITEPHSTDPVGRSRLRGWLVAVQIALSTVLLVSAGLFVRSLQSARHMDLGFDPTDLVMASVDLELQGYDDTRATLFWKELRTRLAALPGIESLTLASTVPFDLNLSRNTVSPEGYDLPGPSDFLAVGYSVVGRDYFSTLRIPLLEGRVFDERELDDPGRRVVVVNRTLAERFWPSGSAVGRRITSPGGTTYEVVGVVETGTYLALAEDPKPYLYYPFRGRSGAMTILVRGSAPPSSLLAGIREAVRALDEELPLYAAKPMAEHLRIALAPAQAGAALFSVFGALALLLAAVGLYGVLAYSVAQRGRELGIRRALGAQGGDLLAVVLRHGLWVVLPGLGVGIAASLGVARVLAGLVYGIRPTDVPVLVSATLLLLAVAVAASLRPARRAVAADPMKALRCE